MEVSDCQDNASSTLEVSLSLSQSILCPNCFRKGKSRGTFHWKFISDEVERIQNTDIAYFVGESVASLELGCT